MIGIVAALLIAASSLSLAPAAEAQPELPAACSDTALAADLTYCDKAIAAEKDKRVRARLLFRRAYAFNAKHKYDEALRDLNEVVGLDPALPNGWHERAYTFGELSEFRPAIKDLDREIALRPAANAYQERAFDRYWSGDFAGALADRNREVELRPDDPGAILARADAALWLGRFEDARKDATAAETLARRTNNDDEVQAARKFQERISLLSAHSPGGLSAKRCAMPETDAQLRVANLIGDCTAAFLAATDNKAKADFLTVRSLIWLTVQQDEASSTADRRIAVALDPTNPDRHANLGFSYLSVHHSWAAEREFNLAFASRRSWMVYAGRASARYNLGRKEEAFADAKKSFEQYPNELALTVLGDLAHDRGDDKSAKLYWLGAYHLGDRDDGLTERLKSIGVDHPENEPKQ